ncbi:MAG: hypothetical protein JW891_00390 [Candidatus Lokiarchaeota archaeon]|nr:hypothetical protein [Candidatus Lokiarchaeota archaeon]
MQLIVFDFFDDLGSNPFFPMIIAGIVFLVMATTWVPILKIGLVAAHAEVKREWKWVFASAFMQAGAVFFVMLPLFFNMLLETNMEGGPPVGLLLGLMSLGLFIDLNILNMFHRIGIKKALIIFLFEIIPVVIIMSATLSMQF